MTYCKWRRTFVSMRARLLGFERDQCRPHVKPSLLSARQKAPILNTFALESVHSCALPPGPMQIFMAFAPYSDALSFCFLVRKACSRCLSEQSVRPLWYNGNPGWGGCPRSEEHTSELQSRGQLVCRLRLEKKNAITSTHETTTPT